jgi:O-antigen ligase
MPGALTATLIAFAILAACRPHSALLATAVLTPIATYIGRGWHPLIDWPEVLVVALCLGYACHRTFGRVRTTADARVGVLTAVFAAIVVAALSVELWLLQMRISTPALLDLLWTQLSSEFFRTGASLPALHASVLLLEGLALLLVAHATCRDNPRRFVQVVAAIALGAAAAAGINIFRLAQSAMRADNFLPTFVEALASVRYNAHHADPNAAGSHFAMLAMVALGLALRSVRAALIWMVPAAVLLVGLWVTGSRAAYLSFFLALGLAVVWRAMSGTLRRSRTAPILATAVIVIGLIIAVAAPMRGGQQSSVAAVRVRAAMAEAAVRMTREYPLFGIGPGQFYHRSDAYTPPQLYVQFPTWPRNENAHNNYLQILAELGIVGLLAFLALVAAGVGRFAAAADGSIAASLHLGVLFGLAAFLISCLAGHPLLIRDSAYAFWMLLGAAAGHAASAHNARAMSPRVRHLLALAIIAVVLSVPFRARMHANASNFEHVGIGVSGWQTSEDGVRYRWMDERATLYIPTDARGLQIKLRPEAPAAQVELRLDDRLANVIQLSGDRFTDVRLPLPGRRPDARFMRLELRVTSGGSRRMMVGRVEPLN